MTPAQEIGLYLVLHDSIHTGDGYFQPGMFYEYEKAKKYAELISKTFASPARLLAFAPVRTEVVP